MKKFLTIFIIICTSIMAVPLAAMTFRPTLKSTDNRKMSEFPGITKADGSLNLGFFSGFENWFKDHFAFRNELIYADARIQNDIFKVSNVDSVISGKDGWLFYKSTLNDYLGANRLSDRQIYNIAHNISIAYDYIRAKGGNFVLTVPANKNTLYGEYMPYYDSYIADSTHNIDVLTPQLEKLDIPYADLVKGFKANPEILYLKTDSHWNNKGALLAYKTIMDATGLAYDDYSNVSEENVEGESGDLSRMMYTFYGGKEKNILYDIPQSYEYQGSFKSVEDGRIETTGSVNSGRLLMFRDSFGNTLIPLIANQFENCFFTKENLYFLEKHMEERNPDTVIFEKVERNIAEFITMPPIISAPLYEGEQLTDVNNNALQDEVISDTIIRALEADEDYYEISGTVPLSLIENDTDILLEINDKTYRAYHTDENGFALYFKKEDIVFPVNVKVLVKGDQIKPVEVKTFTQEV